MCSQFNIEDGRKYTTFWHVMLIISTKVEMQLKCKKKKDFCSVWRKCCDWLNVSKVVCKVLCWRFLTGRCSTVSRPVEVDTEQLETLIESNRHYTMWERANVLKISKSIMLLVKIKKNMSFTEKKCTFLANSIWCY